MWNVFTVLLFSLLLLLLVSGTLFHKSTRWSEALPRLSELFSSDNSRWQCSSPLTPVVCCPECRFFFFFLTSHLIIWSCYTIKKKKSHSTLPAPISQTLRKHKQKGKETNYRYLWLWDAVSLCWTAVAASIYSISTKPLWTTSCQDLWSLHGSPENLHTPFVHQVWRPSCPFLDNPIDLRFSSSFGVFARCGTYYRPSATSPPSVQWAVGRVKGLKQAPLGSLAVNVSLHWKTYVCT